MSNTEAKSIDWSSAKVPKGARFIHYVCRECNHIVVASPRANTDVMPGLYCSECEAGPPYWKYAIEFGDEIVQRPGYDIEVTEP